MSRGREYNYPRKPSVRSTDWKNEIDENSKGDGMCYPYQINSCCEQLKDAPVFSGQVHITLFIVHDYLLVIAIFGLNRCQSTKGVLSVLFRNHPLWLFWDYYCHLYLLSLLLCFMWQCFIMLLSFLFIVSRLGILYGLSRFGILIDRQH